MKGLGKSFTALCAVLVIAFSLIYTETAFLQTSGTGLQNESLAAVAAPAATPFYQIYDLGVVQAGDSSAQGFGASAGGVAVGRSIRTGGAQAFSWTRGGGLIGLPNLSNRTFCVSNGANDVGRVVGTCATTLFGTNKLPVVWQNGAVTQLTLPAGETFGDANDVNAAGTAVGSVNGGSLQRAAVYNAASASVITQTTSNGSFFVTAFGVNDAGRVIGQGIDPNNAARNVGIVYDIGGTSAFEVGALPNANGALAFGVSNAGHVVGASMQNQGSGLPFIWTQAGGIQAIPLPAGTSSGSARAVNSSGWAVGTASSAFAIPFVYDGTATYRLADLIPAGAGWDLSTNTSSSALGISDNNIIVGTGVLNGQVRGFAMVPLSRVPYDFFGSGRTSLATTGVQGGSLVWRVRDSVSLNSYTLNFGANTDVQAAADYDGDGKSDVAVFRSGEWYWLNSSNNSVGGIQFGQAGDVPLPYDFTGDGRAEIAVFRAGIWYIYNRSTNQVSAVQFGAATDKPVPADFDGDGKADVAVYRDGVWYWLRSSDNQVRGVQFGGASDKPVSGDYDGDGRADQAVYRPGGVNGLSYFYLNRSTDGFVGAQFGSGSDVPLVGDYNGDGKSDIAIYRSLNTTFYWLNSPTSPAFSSQQFGSANDMPVAGR